MSCYLKLQKQITIKFRIKNKEVLMETSFQSLQNRGLQLSKPVPIQIPRPKIPDKPLIQKLTNILGNRKQQSKTQPDQIKIQNILNQFMVVWSSTTIHLIQYTIENQQHPVISNLGSIVLNKKINSVHCFAKNYMLDKGKFPFLIQSNHCIQYLTYDFIDQKFINNSLIKMTDIVAINFITEFQALVLTKYQICQLKIENKQKRKQISITRKISNQFNLQKQQVLLKAKIVGKFDEDNDCLFRVVFCTLYEEKQYIKIKQFKKELEKGISTDQQIYIGCTIPLARNLQKDSQQNLINQTATQLQDQSALAICTIQQIDSHICVEVRQEIVIIKKKFNSYVQLDSLIQKISGKKLYLHKDGIVCSVSSTSFQLSYIKFSNSKFQYRLLDQISMEEKNQFGNLKKLWTFYVNKELRVMLLFERNGKIEVSNVIKLQPIDKLLKLVEIKGKKDLKIVQQLGENLGIPKREFYLKLWGNSKKQITDIYQFLIPCQEISSIKAQIKSFLRKSTLIVAQLIKVLDKISHMLEEKIKKDLSTQLIKEYSKNNFLKRKVKLYQMDQAIDCKALETIYSSSILNIFFDSINFNLFPREESHDPMLVMVQHSHINDQTNLKHVFQEFKLVILQRYKQFLKCLFDQYPGKMALIIENYPYLLPMYPFEIEVSHEQARFILAKKEKENQKIKKGQKSEFQSAKQRLSIIPTTMKKQKEASVDGTNKSETEKTSNSTSGAQKCNAQNIKLPLNLSVLNQQAKSFTELIIKKEEGTRKRPNNSLLKILQQNKQCSWFSEINFLDWQRQLHRTQLEQELFQLYPTSFILNTIDSFLLTGYGKQQILIKHAMVKTRPEDFSQVLQPIRGVKLFIYICQLANDYALQKKLEKSQSAQLTKVFNKCHRLTGKILEECRLYSQMHFFMVKNNIAEQEHLTIESLIEIAKQPENLLAMFFLGNRQKRQFILNQFRDLYCSEENFNSVVSSFVNSENCSKIELYIFLDCIIQKGSQFQIDNQKLISIIVNSFCEKLQIRETRFLQTFLKMMGDIDVDHYLATRVNKMVQLRECCEMLEVFGWDSKTYGEILKDSTRSLQGILETYFFENLALSEVIIKDTEISLEFPRNMLNVLLYLRENIFYELSEEEVLLTFGYSMIQWRQFQTIRQMVYEQKIPTKLDIDQQIYLKKLVTKCLQDTIYKRQQITWSQECQQQQQLIISLLPLNDPIRVRQQAKIKLIQILQTWGYTVKPLQIYQLLKKCNQSQQMRSGIMKQIIRQYLHNLNFQFLTQIYTILETIHQEKRVDVNLQSKQFIDYCLYFCQCLIQKSRHRQILEVISFLKGCSKINPRINYNIITESFLACLTQKYRSPQDLNKSKDFIQLYAQYFEYNECVKILFESYFDQQCLKNKISQDDIQIDAMFCFPGGEVFFRVEDIFCCAKNSLNHSQTVVNCMDITYNYYFLSMMLRIPKFALKRLSGISYNIDSIIASLLKFQACIDQNQEYWGFNIIEIYKRLRKGLYYEAINRLSAAQGQIDSSAEQFHFQMVKNLLKKQKQHKNIELLHQINHLESHMSYLNSQKLSQKKRKFEKKLIQTKRQKLDKAELQPQEENITNLSLNITMKYKQLISKKIDVSMQYEYIPEKQLIDQVFEQTYQMRLSQNNVLKNLNNSVCSMYSNTNQRSRVERYCNLADSIKNKQYSSILKDYRSRQIQQAIQSMFKRSQTTLQEMLKLMETLQVGDINKRKIANTFKDFQHQIDNQTIKQIFTYNFFIKPLKLTITQEDPNFQRQARNVCYESITQNLKGVLYDKNIEQAMMLAEFFKNIMQNQEYQKKIYLLGVQGIITAKQNTTRALRRLRDYLRLLSEDEQYFARVMKQTLSSFKNDLASYQILMDSLLTMPRLPSQIQIELLGQLKKPVQTTKLLKFLISQYVKK